jgi:hypothetical protein
MVIAIREYAITWRYARDPTTDIWAEASDPAREAARGEPLPSVSGLMAEM